MADDLGFTPDTTTHDDLGFTSEESKSEPIDFVKEQKAGVDQASSNVGKAVDIGRGWMNGFLGNTVPSVAREGMANLTGNDEWMTQESRDAQAKANADHDSQWKKLFPGSNATENLDFLKDSAFAGVQKISDEVKAATKGLKADVTDEGLPTLTRTVDKDGNPVSDDEIALGAVNPAELRDEAPLDYFLPSLKGKPAPYFESHLVNGAVSKAFTDGDPTQLQVLHSWLLGVGEVNRDPQIKGLMKGLTMMSEPEQFVARQATYLASKAGMIPPDQAKQMLSQEELHFHDLADYYFQDKVSGGSDRLAAGVAGFLTDFLDPAMMITSAPKLMKIGAEGMEVGGRVITDASQLSKAQRALVRVHEEVKPLIDYNSEEKYLSSNQMLQAQYEKVSLSGEKGIGFQDFVQRLSLDPEHKEEIKAIWDRAQNPSIFDEFANGYRGMFVRLPFTELKAEIPFLSAKAPGLDFSMTEAGGQALESIKNGVAKTMDSVSRRLMQARVNPDDALNSAGELYNTAMNAGSKIARVATSFATDSSRPLMSMATRAFIGDQNFAKLQRNAFKEQWYSKFKLEDGTLDMEKLRGVSDLVELTPMRSDEELLAKFGKTSEDEFGHPTPESERLTDARARVQELRGQMTADQLDLADQIISDNRTRLDKFEARGMDFKELNPFKDMESNQLVSTGYLKHLVTREFASKMNGVDNAYDKAYELMKNVAPSADKSQLERQMSGLITNMNRESESTLGVKMFVEDPIALHDVRTRELDNLIRNHDFLHSVQDLGAVRRMDEEKPPRGWVKFDPEAWGNSVKQVKNDQGDEIKWFEQFMPSWIKNQMANGNEVYFPQDVSMRLNYLMNPRMFDGPLTGPLKDSYNFSKYLYRNTALFGTGYNGMKFGSHLTTSIVSGTAAEDLIEATKFFLPTAETRAAYDFGNGLMMEHEELFNALQQQGILHTGMLSQDSPEVMDRIAENLGSSYPQRSKFMKDAGTVFDHSMLFSTNRWIDSSVDDIAKVGHVMTKLKQGYTMDAAAESAERWFYNFSKNPPPTMVGGIPISSKTISDIIPFSGSGLRTAEKTLSDLKNLDIAHLTLPTKVNRVLQGAYVDDAQTRKFMMTNVPDWQKDSTLGPLLPGNKQLMFEFPWVYHTMKALWSPFNDDQQDIAYAPINPVMKMAVMGWAGLHGPAMDEVDDQGKWKQLISTTADAYMPPVIKHAYIMYQLQHPEEEFFVPFKDKYIPSLAFTMNKNEGAAAEKFKDNAAFGNWMLEKYGENSFMNMYLWGKPQPNGDSVRQQAMEAGFGNYLRSHMRDLSFGIARATNLDSQFFSNDTAISKQIERHMYELKGSMSAREHGLINENAILKSLDKSQGSTDKELALKANIMALQEKRESLREYRNEVLKDDKLKTGIFSQILGIEPNKVTFRNQQLNIDSLNLRQNANQIKGTLRKEFQ